MSYTTPPQFSGFQPSPPRQEIDFGVLSEAFTVLFKHWQVYIIPGLISMLLFLPSMVLAYWPMVQQMLGSPPSAGEQFASFGLQMLFTGAGALIAIFLYPGIVQFTMNVVRGLPASSSDLWIGFRDPLGYFAVSFIAGLVAALGVFACCIGVIFTAGLMMFALPIKVATGATPTDSVSQSWNMLKKDWLLAGLFYFVVSLISELGAIACYVGMIITLPMIYIAPTILYCRWVGIVPAYSSDPISPYPRGGAGYGQNIGEQSRQKPEGEPPPKPDDLS
jgi:hypothetical protein